MKYSKIFAIVKKPNEETQICLIEKDLKAFNTIIQGKREIIPFPSLNGACIILDGNASANNKKPNIFIPEYEDLMIGTIIITAIDYEIGFISLTEEQVEKILDYIKTNNASDLKGSPSQSVKNGYLSNSDETAIFSFLSEVKSKYKAVKVKWLDKEKSRRRNAR